MAIFSGRQPIPERRRFRNAGFVGNSIFQEFAFSFNLLELKLS